MDEREREEWERGNRLYKEIMKLPVEIYLNLLAVLNGQAKLREREWVSEKLHDHKSSLQERS